MRLVLSYVFEFFSSILIIEILIYRLIVILIVIVIEIIKLIDEGFMIIIISLEMSSPMNLTEL